MKKALIVIIFSCILLLGIVAVAKATEPEMRTTLPVISIPEWIAANNPPCDENAKLFQLYSKLATDGKTCWRYRPWVCISTGNEGVDVEHLPLPFCQSVR